MKIKKSTLISGILSVCLYHSTFIRIRYYNNYDMLKYLFIFLAAIILIFNCNLRILNKNCKINMIILLFISSVLWSSFRNPMNIPGGFLRGIVSMLILLEIFLVVQQLAAKNKMNILVKTFYLLSILYAIITDLTMLIRPSLFIKFNEDYLIGNKFIVSYLHIYIVIFYLILNIKKIKKGYLSKRIILSLLLLWSICISIYTECSTALIANILIIIFYIFFKKNLNAKKWLLTLLISDSILIIFNEIVLSNPVVIYLIGEVLGKSLDLHGRLGIYESVAPVITNEFLWGYGSYNYNDVLTNLIQAPNAQNGIMNCIVQYGIIGSSILVILIYLILNKVKSFDVTYPLYVLIFVFTIISSVEITIDIYLILFVAIAWGIVLENKITEVKSLKNLNNTID